MKVISGEFSMLIADSPFLFVVLTFLIADSLNLIAVPSFLFAVSYNLFAVPSVYLQFRKIYLQFSPYLILYSKKDASML